MNRALYSAGIWAGTSYALGLALGANVSLYDCGVDGVVMGGSALASDYVHQMIGWQPTGLTSAAVTGAVFAGAQRFVRGSEALGTNFAAAAANDYLVEYVGSMMAARAMESDA